MKYMSNISKSILLIIVGPIVTLILYVGGEGGKVSQADLAIIVRNILICAAIAIVVSVIMHLFIKSFIKSLIMSTILAEMLFVPSLITFLLVSAPANRPKTEMWMPVIMIFTVINTLPMVFLISYGLGKIIENWRIRHGRP